ncbi:MAG: ketoacyl-ACP synthase III [Algibacter sp.]
MSKKVAITATGHFVPDKPIDNKVLSKLLDNKLTPSQILEKTGISERKYATDLSTTDMVVSAVQDLLKKSDKDIKDIDCLIVGTLTPDYFFPSTAVNAINKLGATNAWGFDISAACSGFCYGVSIATDMINSGSAKSIIVCGSDLMSNTLNSFDYKTKVLFGDGAGAVLLESTNSSSSHINGKLCRVKADNLEVEEVYYKTPFYAEGDWNDEKFELQGGLVYRAGVSIMIDAINEYLRLNVLTLDDFNYIIPHQANLNMLQDIAKGIGKTLDYFKINIQTRGNTGGASIPICLSEFVDKGEIRKGDRMLMVSFGAGYTFSVIDFTY